MNPPGSDDIDQSARVSFRYASPRSRLIIDYHVQSFFTTLISRWQKEINSLSKRIRFLTTSVWTFLLVPERNASERGKREMFAAMFARQLGARLPWSPWLRRLWLPEPSHPIHFWASCLFYDPIIRNVSSIPCPKLPTVHSSTLSFCTFVHSLDSLVFPRTDSDTTGEGRLDNFTNSSSSIRRLTKLSSPSYNRATREKNVLTLFVYSLPSSCD